MFYRALGLLHSHQGQAVALLLFVDADLNPGLHTTLHYMTCKRLHQKYPFKAEETLWAIKRNIAALDKYLFEHVFQKMAALGQNI